MVLPRLIVALACLGFTAGARVKTHLQQQQSATAVPWSKGQIFICMQKWEKGSKKFKDEFCLADFAKVLVGNEKIQEARGAGKKTPKIMVAKSMSKCEAKSLPHRMKVCNLKGKEDIRLSYKEKVHIPKSCFLKIIRTHTGGGGSAIPLLEAAVERDECLDMLHNASPEAQNALGVQVISTGNLKPGPKDHETFDWDNLQDLTLGATRGETVETDVEEDMATNNFLLEKMMEQDSTEDGFDTNGGDEVHKAEIVEDVVVPDTVEHTEPEVDGAMDLNDMSIAQVRNLWRQREAANKQLPKPAV
jgi:hypothetical protein